MPLRPLMKASCATVWCTSASALSILSISPSRARSTAKRPHGERGRCAPSRARSTTSPLPSASGAARRVSWSAPSSAGRSATLSRSRRSRVPSLLRAPERTLRRQAQPNCRPNCRRCLRRRRRRSRPHQRRRPRHRPRLRRRQRGFLRRRSRRCRLQGCQRMRPHLSRRNGRPQTRLRARPVQAPLRSSLCFEGRL